MWFLMTACKEIYVHFYLLKKALGKRTWEMSSSDYTSVWLMSDFLALIDFIPLLTCTSCKKKKSDPF